MENVGGLAVLDDVDAPAQQGKPRKNGKRGRSMGVESRWTDTHATCRLGKDEGSLTHRDN